MKIKKVICAPGRSSFFFDDQRAIKAGAQHEGFIYKGQPVTEGFKTIRKSGENISVMLVLEDGQIALGDCAAVQYSGAGGRDPLFLASTYIPIIEKEIAPRLEGRDITSFKEMADEIEHMTHNGLRLHTAIRYGLTQVILDAVALSQHKLKAEIICDEYNLPLIADPIPIFAQSGDNRYENVDKMILKEADVLPHGLINNIEEKLGTDGEKLKEYISWLKQRITDLRLNPDYHPALHIDVYGNIGTIFNHDMKKIASYLASLQKYAGDFELAIEGPVDMEEKPKQIEAMKEIYDELQRLGSPVKTVADEWCNTLEDIKDFTDARACHMVQIKTPDLGGIQNIVESIIYCNERNMEAYQGGSCNETDVSARSCVHLAMAARPCRMLAKPGMGFDEGFTIVNNEMQRIMALLR
jgi:methylaspartate ammonia-lyase